MRARYLHFIPNPKIATVLSKAFDDYEEVVDLKYSEIDGWKKVCSWINELETKIVKIINE